MLMTLYVINTLLISIMAFRVVVVARDSLIGIIISTLSFLIFINYLCWILGVEQEQKLLWNGSVVGLSILIYIYTLIRGESEGC